MFTTLHFILPHSFPSNTPFSLLAVPPQGAHMCVRAPLFLSSSSSSMARKRVILSTRSSSNVVMLLIVVVFLHFVVSLGEPGGEADSLLKFKESLKNADKLSNWDRAKGPCDGDHEIWTGVLCEKGYVWGLKLESIGLSGIVDVDALSTMQNLRTISIMNNAFEGTLPNIAKLGALKTVYFSNNKFSGEIPAAAFSGMSSLKKLHLENNMLSGPIPAVLAELPRLMELNLENNQLTGPIPNFQLDRLKIFNFSSNKLSGQIPPSLSNANGSSFSGNEGLCGAPLQPCAAEKGGSSGPPVAIIAGVAVVVVVVLIVIVIVMSSLRKKTSQASNQAAAATGQAQNKDATARSLDRMEQGRASPAPSSSSSPDHNSKQNVKLTFLREGGEQFDLPDLLKASAEVLGSGIFGSTYKAGLPSGKMMVVKRFKHMNTVSKEEFNEHMRRLGRLSHPNVLPVVAFYYRKEEKLLVADFAHNLSLATQLHGKRSRKRPPMDWPTRLNIVKGVGKGLQYLYNELPSLTAPHGHLKSSNVLLDTAFKPVLTDYALIPIVNQEHAQRNMISYKSPEFKESRKINKKTDIWSFGVLILEILTGRFPALQQSSGTDADLVAWVEAALKKEGDAQAPVVFDADMGGTNNAHGEMMKLLKIGLNCCQADTETRPEMKEVVDKIDEIKEKDGDDDFYSSYTSDGDMRSSRGLSDDFKTINV
ncbi:Pollen receptor-like kinase [Sesamum alatum]|uniref:non-specific serine/threonine protein kinase n=1 Tax=Sesamum alatum TaxID=300844 RepID=A0AAE1YMR9_9LAMI|nr:Pollen receptor-like kinase [Sesamum alatum]